MLTRPMHMPPFRKDSRSRCPWRWRCPGRATTAHPLVIAAFTRGGHPPKIVAGISSGPTGRARGGHRVRGGAAARGAWGRRCWKSKARAAERSQAVPRLEAARVYKPLQEPGAGSRRPGTRRNAADWRADGSGASSRSAAKMRDCEVPYIGDERGESLIACARREPPRPCVFPARRGGKPQTRDLSIPVARIDHKRQGIGCVGKGAASRSIMKEWREVQRWCERQSR